ncbi:MAG: hypothetical protein KJ963_02635, partial [Bacteroidetes bacterium]|nr:hypothetical protein [Bacteroidota bacterium]
MSDVAMIDTIKNKIYNSKPFQDLENLLKTGQRHPIIIDNLYGSLTAFLAVKVFEERDSQVLLITTDKDSTEKFFDDCSLILGGNNVSLFGERPPKDVEILDVAAHVSQIETLKLLSSGTPVLTVASPYSIVSKVANPETFKKNIIEIHSNQIYDFQKLIDKLYDFNFQKKDFVEGCGDFAVRGGIIDIFPYIGSNPVRFEFFGNTVESIREFDILSQRSIRELQSASIVPDMKAPEDSGNRDVSIFNYLSDDAIIIIHEPEIINTEIEELHKENIPNIFDNKFLNDKIELFKRIVVSPIEKSHYTGESEALNFSSSSQPAFNGSVNKLVERLEQLTLDGYQTYLSCDT